MLLLPLLSLASLTAQAAPDRVADTLVVSGVVADLDLAATGEWAAATLEGSDKVELLSTATWDTQSVTVCSGGEAAGVAFSEAGEDLQVFVGCSDGTLASLTYSGGWILDDEAIDLDDAGAVLGIVEDEGLIYAIAENSDTSLAAVVHLVDASTREVNASGGYPVSLAYTGYIDVAGNSTAAYVCHSSDNVSEVTLGSAGVSADQTSSTGGSCEDIVAFDGDVLIAAGTAGVLRYVDDTNYVQVGLSAAELEDISALAKLAAEDYLLLADPGQGSFLLYDYDKTTIGSSLVAEFDIATAGRPVEIVALEGYAVAGTDESELLFLTDRPWVEAAGVSDATPSTGDAVSFTFTSDAAGSWTASVGEDGEALASGTIEEGGSATVEFTVEDGLLTEGQNFVWVQVTDAEGDIGHDAVVLTVDTPPDTITLASEDVGFGENVIYLGFDGIEDADLDYYEVFVSREPFDAADYPAGTEEGPTFWGEGGADTGSADAELDVPLQYTAEPGERVEITIEGVTNDVTYYLAVRAVDTSDQEGAMSNVVSATPRETYGAAELAGEQGGFCGTALAPSLLLASLSALAVLRRRGVPAALLAASVASGAANAQELPGAKEREPILAQSTTIQLGPSSFTNGSLSRVYGDSGKLSMWLSTGTSARHILGMDAGIGFIRATGDKVADDGSGGYVSADEESRLLVVPLTLSGTARLKVIEGQPLVPYASVGADYWLWRESWAADYKLFTSDAIGGGKYGWHWAAGGELLLDMFEPDRASALKARTGIVDTYLAIEYRKQEIGEEQQSDGDGLLFSGSTITVGLRLDY